MNVIRLVLTLKGREITLTVDEARTLYAELGELLGKKEVAIPFFPPNYPPVIYSSAGKTTIIPFETGAKTGENPFDLV